jgi:hypothetical protein
LYFASSEGRQRANDRYQGCKLLRKKIEQIVSGKKK